MFDMEKLEWSSYLPIHHIFPTFSVTVYYLHSELM